MTAQWQIGRRVVAVLAVWTGLGLAAPSMWPLGAQTAQGEGAAAQQKSSGVSCEMTFTMKGWSAFVTKAEGTGTVTCDNDQRADVILAVTGGGLTFGRTSIEEGKGVFSDVTDMSEIFGSYAQAEASAGAVESVSAQALTKGSVSLAITTKGSGWSLGVSGARFSIQRAEAK
jgi:hypothetical protein